MKVEKIKEIKAPGDGILSVSFQPHPIGEKWDKERVAICGEKGVHIWSFEYNGNYKKLAFIESSTCALIKMCRWSLDGKYLAIVDMEQIAIYFKGTGGCLGTPKNLSSGTLKAEEVDADPNEVFENWIVYATFSSSDVNECADICWLKGSKVLVNGTISGHLIVYNLEERCQSSNLFIRDIIETSMRNKNISNFHTEIGHVSGLCSDARGFFLACQMSSRRLLIFNVEYNKENGKQVLTKRNCITLTFLLEEERLIINSPCILTFIRRPAFDPLTCLIGCPYGEVGTSYFSCLFPFRDISDVKPFGWEELCKIVNYELEKEGEGIKSDIWNLHNEGKTTIKSKLELPEAYRLRGHQRRVRIFQFSTCVIKEKDEIFSLCAQSSQDGSLSFWKVIYDLKSKSKIKSIECFLVLTNFMDEQASVTDISFNNLNNSVLIGSDDNKLTLVTFELEEFLLAKSSSKDSQEFYYSGWNYWNFEFIPEKPNLKNIEIDLQTEESNSFSKHISLPVITANEIREHQERTQEAVIGSKGTKIRRIQPLNLTEMYKNKSDNNNNNNNEIQDHQVLNNVSTLQEDKSAIQNIETNNKKNKKNYQVKSSSKDQSRNDEFEKNSQPEKINNSLKLNENQMNYKFINFENLTIPPRLAIETNLIINQKNFKIAVFADNRQIIENINRNRSSSTEIICMKQENSQENEISTTSKEMLWYKPICNNHVITHMIRIKDILMVIYSDILEKKDFIASSNLDFLNFNTGSTLIGGISLPFILKVVISESLDMILLVTINGKIKIFKINGTLNHYESFLPKTSTHLSSGFSINWVLDAEWSHLNNQKLARVDLYSNQYNNKNNHPIIIIYFEDGKTFSYSFNISSFVRIDDLEFSRSDFWSLVFPRTYLQILKKNHHHYAKAKLLELVSEAVTSEYQETEIELSTVCLDPRGVPDTESKFQLQKCFFLREIQQNSRQILLNNQYSQKIDYSNNQKIQSIFENILSTSLFDDYSEEESPSSAQNQMNDFNHSENHSFETEIAQSNQELSQKDYSFDKGNNKVIKEDLNGNILYTKMHIEHQMVSSILLQSKSEFKYWFKIFVKFSLDSFDLESIKDITHKVLALVRENILNNNKQNQGQIHSSDYGQMLSDSSTTVAPVWFSSTILESIDIDPTHILIDEVLNSINDFITLVQNPQATIINKDFITNNRLQTNIEQFIYELTNIKEKIASQVKSIQEDFEAYKNTLLNNSQYFSSSQNSDNNYSSRLDFLDSIFS